MINLKLILITLFLILIAIILNIEVARLKIENKELLNKIEMLEEERVYYEDYFYKKMTLLELENKAREIGLEYPKDILRLKISNGYVVESKKEEYFAFLFKDYSLRNKP